MPRREKPANAGRLIPASAIADMNASDAAKREYAAKGPSSFRAFRTQFAQSIMFEFTLATEWGCCADTEGEGINLRITKTIAQKYPIRKQRWYEKHLLRFGFVFPPVEGVKGFKFLGKRYGG